MACAGVERQDPYSEIAIVGDQDFELRGSDLAVPLRFKPDASFIVRTILTEDSQLTSADIARGEEFRKICEGTYCDGRFAAVISHIRFTFDALGSTVMQIRKAGNTNLYYRNPSYNVVDERPQEPSSEEREEAPPEDWKKGLENLSRSERLAIKYYGIDGAQHEGEAVCLNDFWMLAGSKATYEDVEEAMTDTDVVDVTRLENGNIEVGCRVPDCRFKVLVEPGKSMLPSNSCRLYEAAIDPERR